MRIRWHGRSASCVAWACCCAAGLSTIGCAHHRADQYSSAPPYAPAVYPQPQTAAQPVAYAAPPNVVIPGGQPGMAPPVGQPAGVIVAGAAPPGGMVVTAAGELCPPCSAQGMEGIVVDSQTMIQGGGQSPPCPPGP